MIQIQSAIGIGVFILIAFYFSENKKRVNWKMVALGVGMQLILGLVLLKIDFVSQIFFHLNKVVTMIQSSTLEGTKFMFGYLAGGEAPFELKEPRNNFIVAFNVLPIVLVMSALTSVLFHWGILQKIVKFLSSCLEKSLKISGVQGLSVGANIFLGIVESPLFVKPYLNKMSRSTLFVLMTAGMATVAGTVMVLYASIIGNAIPNAIGHILIASLISAPAAVLISHIMIPPDEVEDIKEANVEIPRETSSTMDALVKGTMDGVQLLISIIAMIIVLFALVDFANQILAHFPDVRGRAFTVQYIVSLIFRPLVWFMGIPWNESLVASELMATKTVLNEFVSYTYLANLNIEFLSEKSRLIMTYAMCGFANFASLGLVIGSLGVLAPQRRAEVISLSFRCLISGTLATMMTGAIVGLLA